MIGTNKADTTAKETIGINQADTTAREKDHTLPNLHHRIGENQDGMDNNAKVGMEDIVKPIQRFLYMLVKDVTIADTTALILLWTLHVAWSIGAQYLLEFMYNVNHELVCSYSVSHFLELCLLIAALVDLTFLSVILYSRIYTSCRSFFGKTHAAVQRKFVSVCFLFLLFWGTPKDMDLRNAYMYSLPRHFTV